MKLLKMKTEDGQIDYMVKFETKAEEKAYLYWNINHGKLMSMMLSTCSTSETGVLTDDDICYYIYVDEAEPEVGETFELDDFKWERVA